MRCNQRSCTISSRTRIVIIQEPTIGQKQMEIDIDLSNGQHGKYMVGLRLVGTDLGYIQMHVILVRFYFQKQRHYDWSEQMETDIDLSNGRLEF